MEFETLSQETAYKRVRHQMEELFGENLHVHPARPVFGSKMGSAVVFVTVSAWGSDDAVIGVRAHVVIGARLEADLLQFLLLKNAEFRFGAFGLDQKGNVVFQHNIVGLTCDKPELHASVLAVLGTADAYDDPIQRRWGGLRAVDYLREMGENPTIWYED
jgi:hypothetical protein